MPETTITQEQLDEAVLAMGDQVVYFAQCGERGPIKIGITKRHRLQARLAVIQTGSPFPIILRRVFPGNRDLERKLHRLYRNVRMSGEWFQATPDLAAVANAIPTPPLDV